MLTTLLGKHDPRLLEEALDWCSRYHAFVSVSRLRTLVEELGQKVHVPFSLFAETLNSLSQAKWPTFAKVTPLKTNLKRKSQPPNCQIPALVSLRLRALFGVGARADLATFFLTQQSGPFTAADMIEIGYNKRTLAVTLDFFFQAGLLTCSMIRNQKQYEFAKKEQLASLAGELPRLVPNWRSLIAIFFTVRDILAKHESSSLSSVVVALRNAFISLEEPLKKLNIMPPPLSSNLKDWKSYVEWTVATLKSLVDEETFKKGCLCLVILKGTCFPSSGFYTK